MCVVRGRVLPNDLLPPLRLIIIQFVPSAGRQDCIHSAWLTSMVFLELMRMNFRRQLQNNSGLSIPSLTLALLSPRFQFPHHTFPMILSIPQDLSDSRFCSRTTMLLPTPGRQGSHHFDLKHVEKTERYETVGVRRRGKLRNCLFCFLRIFLLHYTPRELGSATQHHEFHSTLFFFHLDAEPSHAGLPGSPGHRLCRFSPHHAHLRGSSRHGVP